MAEIIMVYRASFADPANYKVVSFRSVPGSGMRYKTRWLTLSEIESIPDPTAAPKRTLICAREDSLLSPLGVRKRRPKFLSNELLIVLAVGLVGALGLWLILRVSS